MIFNQLCYTLGWQLWLGRALPSRLFISLPHLLTILDLTLPSPSFFKNVFPPLFHGFVLHIFNMTLLITSSIVSLNRANTSIVITKWTTTKPPTTTPKPQPSSGHYCYYNKYCYSTCFISVFYCYYNALCRVNCLYYATVKIVISFLSVHITWFKKKTF